MTTISDVLYAWGAAEGTKHSHLDAGRTEQEATAAGLQALIDHLDIPLTDYKQTRNTTHLRSIK